MIKQITGNSNFIPAGFASMSKRNVFLGALLFAATGALAGDADIQLPLLDQVSFFHGAVTSRAILFFGLLVCAVGAAFGL